MHITTNAAGFLLAYLPQSGVVHLATPDKFDDSLFGETTPICGQVILHGAVQLSSVPSCYSKCSGCTAAAAR